VTAQGVIIVLMMIVFAGWVTVFVDWLVDLLIFIVGVIDQIAFIVDGGTTLVTERIGVKARKPRLRGSRVGYGRKVE
jgi:hypothetical protein